jgi:hypothetical protein
VTVDRPSSVWKSRQVNNGSSTDDYDGEIHEVNNYAFILDYVVDISIACEKFQSLHVVSYSRTLCWFLAFSVMAFNVRFL